MIQDCGRQVNDVGKLALRALSLRRSRVRDARTRLATAIYEQNPRNSIRIDDVISAPTASVVLEERVLKTADRALPRDAISRTKIDHEIGSMGSVRPRVEFLAAHHVANCGSRTRSVRHSGKPARNGPTYPLGFGAFFQNALALTTLEVQVDPPKSDGIGVGTRPIDPSKAVPQVFSRLAAVLEGEQAILPQPGIGIEGAAKGVKSVIGQHHQQRVFINFIE